MDFLSPLKNLLGTGSASPSLQTNSEDQADERRKEEERQADLRQKNAAADQIRVIRKLESRSVAANRVSMAIDSVTADVTKLRDEIHKTQKELEALQNHRPTQEHIAIHEQRIVSLDQKLYQLGAELGPYAKVLEELALRPNPNFEKQVNELKAKIDSLGKGHELVENLQDPQTRAQLKAWERELTILGKLAKTDATNAATEAKAQLEKTPWINPHGRDVEDFKGAVVPDKGSQFRPEDPKTQQMMKDMVAELKKEFQNQKPPMPWAEDGKWTALAYMHLRQSGNMTDAMKQLRLDFLKSPEAFPAVQQAVHAEVMDQFQNVQDPRMDMAKAMDVAAYFNRLGQNYLVEKAATLAPLNPSLDRVAKSIVTDIDAMLRGQAAESGKRGGKTSTLAPVEGFKRPTDSIRY